MKAFRSINHCLGWFAIMVLATTSCNKYDYTDELQGLGARVERLEQMVLEANKAYQELYDFFTAIQTEGYITKVEKNADGTTTITFNTGKTVTLRDGKQGKDAEANLLISVDKYPIDGKWYWKLNGDWLRDAQGKMIPAGAIDGKDGKDGEVSTSSIIPQVRMNPITHYLEISTDNGANWTIIRDNYGNPITVQDGTDGTDDYFESISISPDGKTATITLRMYPNQTFVIPIKK